MEAANYREKAEEARVKAEETDGVVREEWRKLAEHYDDIAIGLERSEKRWQEFKASLTR